MVAAKNFDASQPLFPVSYFSQFDNSNKEMSIKKRKKNKLISEPKVLQRHIVNNDFPQRDKFV